jgi:hypothetical protein
MTTITCSVTLKSKSKELLAPNQDNVSEGSDLCNHDQPYYKTEDAYCIFSQIKVLLIVMICSQFYIFVNLFSNRQYYFNLFTNKIVNSIL